MISYNENDGLTVTIKLDGEAHRLQTIQKAPSVSARLQRVLILANFKQGLSF